MTEPPESTLAAVLAGHIDGIDYHIKGDGKRGQWTTTGWYCACSEYLGPDWDIAEAAHAPHVAAAILAATPTAAHPTPAGGHSPAPSPLEGGGSESEAPTVPPAGRPLRPVDPPPPPHQPVGGSETAPIVRGAPRVAPTTTPTAAHVAQLEAALAAAEARLRAVEALADEWDVLADYVDDPDSTADQRARSKAGVIAATQLRAALTPPQPAP